MLIAINNLEPKFKNLALEKIKLYYVNLGHQVEEYLPLLDACYDKIYCSSIFNFTSKPHTDKRWTCGGTGFDLTTKLPPEIEAMKPKLNFGFTTRGCIRKCPFCVVPEKEGKIHAVGDIYDLWDGEAGEITLYDNNILALPEHLKLICEQLKKENLGVDFNQGLDIRLLTDDILKLLKQVRHKEYRFAFDEPKHERIIMDKVKLLNKHGIKKAMFYVLVGFNTTFEQDLHRLNVLRSIGQNAYVMRYVKKQEYIPLARWVNQRHLFHGMTYEQFLQHLANHKYRKVD